jgi:hypothetical protein
MDTKKKIMSAHARTHMCTAKSRIKTFKYADFLDMHV